MKYLVLTAVALFVIGGCSSASKKGVDSASYNNEVKAEAQEATILDQEFDLLVAPEYDYETEVPYAEQIKNTATKKEQVKSSKKPVAVKK